MRGSANPIGELAIAFRRWLIRRKILAPTPPRVNDGTTLVVIDMQAPYVYGCKRPELIIDPVNELVEREKAAGSSIVEVEMDGDGPTIPEVHSCLADYRRRARVIKTDANGGREVSAECMLRSYGTQVFKICGLWPASCIFDTTEELARLYPQSRIEVHAKACGFGPGSHVLFEQLPPNVVIVR